jgi:drug/metabolite transporter (DMT)-like permease
VANAVRERIHPDVVGALAVLAVSGLMFLGARGRTGGSWIYPRFVAWTLLVLGAVLLVQSVLQSERVKLWRSRTSGIEVLLYIAGIMVYLFSLRRIGFWVPTLIMIFASTTLLGERRDRRTLVTNALTSLIVVVIVYFVFVEAFNVRLPAGDWVRLAP